MKPSGTPLSFPDAEILVYAAPKAACTSIKRTLAQAYAEPGQTEKEALKNIRKSLHDLKRNERSPDFLRIGFCRDPIEKIQSIYVDKLIRRRTVKPLLSGLGFYKGMPFAEYIDLVAATPDEEAEKHLKSQHLFLFRDGPPNILIKFEDLDEGWKRVQRVFKGAGGQKIPRLQRLNVSHIEKPKLTANMKRLIAERYKTDMQLLGYRI